MKKFNSGQIIKSFIGSGGRLKILLSEDMIINLKYLEMVFHKLGFSCDCARDGKETIDLMRQNRYDMVLLDIEMPIMNGEEVLQLLKREGLLRNTRIIAQTAYSMEGDEQKFFSLGCSGYLAKPIDMDKLEKAIAETIVGLNRNNEAT
jgi:CheY-like chemotaxis protein